MTARRVRSEDGYAVPLALAVIALVAALGGVAIALATHNVERSSRDRAAVRAQAAADAGLDAAAYRMSKMVLASEIDSLLSPSTVNALLAEAGCLNLGVGDFAVSLSTTTCDANSEETLDESVGDDGVGEPATFRYWVQLSANVIVNGRSLLERRIVSVGEADGVVRRVMGTYRLDLGAPVTSTATRTSYVACTAVVPPAGTNPAAGC